MDFYAKSDQKTTILMHTRDLLNHYNRFINCYPTAFEGKDKRLIKAIKIAALYHDLGKINSRFQNVMYKKELLTDILRDAYEKHQINQIPHGVLSLSFMDIQELNYTFGKEIAKAIRMAVCYHHDRTLVYEFKQYKELIEEIIEKDLNKNARDLDFPLLYRLLATKENMRKMPEMQRITTEDWLNYAIIKGMLNRLDYAASSGLEKNTFEIKHNDGGVNLTENIKLRIINNLNCELNEVQRYMADNCNNNLIVRASTGLGKTEGALLWISEDKAFYTLPLRVSINAIYDRIHKEYNYKNVRLLHSNSFTKYIDVAKENNEIDPLILYSQSRLLASPLTVCTVDQLFPFVFKHNGGEQLIATLSYSKIVIDEIQMYDSEIIAALIVGLKLIQEAGGKFAIITATMPTFIAELMKRENIFFEVSKPFFSKGPPRHLINLSEEDIDLEAIRSDGKNKKVLVIVNTVAKAQLLYKQLEDEDVKILHGQFIRRHRVMLEEAIMNFSKYGEKGIWITTQIVEASLDIDFDVLYTEMCSADSLLQRLGRCNRRGRLLPIEPNIFVFNTKNGRQTGNNRGIYDKIIYDVSWERLQNYANKQFEEKDKFEYVNNVYDEDKNIKLADSRYYVEIIRKLEILKNIKPFDKSKERVEKEFRNILSITLMPDSIYDNLSTIGVIEEWQQNLKEDRGLTKQDKLKIKNEIQDYTVSISLSYFNDKRVDKGVREIIFMHSNIFRSRNAYNFDESKLSGVGFIKGEFNLDNTW